MNLLNLQRAARAAPVCKAAACTSCCHFQAEPLALERALPGLNALSSGYASVRAEDGLCAVHDRYVAASSSCPQHSAAYAA
jgi:hypothetical protein